MTNISCHLAAPTLSRHSPCSSAMSLLPFLHLLCLHIGRAGRPLERPLHSWLPLLCLGSPLAFAQTYRSLPPPLLCHLFCPGLKIHFRNQSVSPATTSNPLSFILWPLSSSFNPFHISVSNVCFIEILLSTSSSLLNLKMPLPLFWGQRSPVHLGTCFALDSFVKNPHMHLQINADCCAIGFL